MKRTTTIAAVAATVLGTALAEAPGEAKMRAFRCSFDGQLDDAAGVAPIKAERVTFTAGRNGQAAVIERPAALTYPANVLTPDCFTISLRVKHPKRFG